MNEEVVRVLQETLTAIAPIHGELERVRDLEVREIVGGNDTGWQAVNYALESASTLCKDLKQALIDVTISAYLVLKDSAAKSACLIGVSSRFPRRLRESCQNGARFDLIVGSSGAIELRDLEGRALISIDVDGPRCVYKAPHGRRIALYAFSSIDHAGDKEFKLNKGEVAGFCGWSY